MSFIFLFYISLILNVFNFPLIQFNGFMFNAEKYIAIYPYNSTEPDDLSFEQNDVITIIKKEGEWWTGTLKDKTGVFPSNYVQKMDYQVNISIVKI